MDDTLQKIMAAAQGAGLIIKRYFSENPEAAEKSSAVDLRTAADEESEKAIIQSLEKDFPTYNILSEERGLIDKKSDRTFVVDPLDGTHNFVIGLPVFAVSIALMADSEIIAGVVHHPITSQTYAAAKAQGAFLNGKPLKIKAERTTNQATVAYCTAYGKDHRDIRAILGKLYEQGVSRIIEPWAVALMPCLLASDKIECVIINENDLHDFAAGKIIAREAGARITDFFGQPEQNDKSNQLVISNGAAIHERALAALS